MMHECPHGSGNSPDLNSLLKNLTTNGNIMSIPCMKNPGEISSSPAWTLLIISFSVISELNMESCLSSILVSGSISIFRRS